MPTNQYYRGAATPALPDTQTSTLSGTPAATNTMTAAVPGTGESFTVTLGATSAGSLTTAASAFANAFNATDAGWSADSDETIDHAGQEINPFKEITASADTGVLTFTSNTTGKPFNIDLSATGGGVAFGALTPTVNPYGVYTVTTGANWSSGSAPSAGDSAFFDGGNVGGGLYKWDGLNALEALYILGDHSTAIGLDEISYPETSGVEDTDYPYYQYLDQFAAIGCNSASFQCLIARTLTTAGKIKLKFSTNDPLVNVNDAVRKGTDGIYPIQLATDSVDMTLNVVKGVVEVRSDGTVNALSVSGSPPSTDVRMGGSFSGTNPTANFSGGVIYIDCSTTNISAGTGTFDVNGSAQVFMESGTHTGFSGADMIVREGATMYIQQTGAFGEISVDGMLDMNKGSGSVTIGKILYGPNARILDDAKRISGGGTAGFPTNGFVKNYTGPAGANQLLPDLDSGKTIPV